MENSSEDKISAYLRGELSDLEQQSLVDKIANDPELAKELNRQKMISEHIELLEDRKITEQVRAVHKREMERRRKSLRFKKLKKWAIAAIVLLLISLAWWLWQRPTTPEKLFAENYAAYDLYFGDRGEGDLMIEAGGLYLSANYESAIPLFEKLLEQDKTLTKARFALGICQMELGNWEKAISNFQPLIEEKDILYAENAQWYVALALIKLDKLEEAKTYLNQLKGNNNARFQQKATTLLKALE